MNKELFEKFNDGSLRLPEGLYPGETISRVSYQILAFCRCTFS